MSRLDSFIRRMSAQRDILNALASRLDGVDGLILEFGFGSGRTYDHLRATFPGRRVIAFDMAPPSCGYERVARDDFVIGDLRRTSDGFPAGCAALVHADLETGFPAIDVELATWLPQTMARLLAPGGLAVSGSVLTEPDLQPLPLPATVAEGRYHVCTRRSPLSDRPVIAG